MSLVATRLISLVDKTSTPAFAKVICKNLIAGYELIDEFNAGEVISEEKLLWRLYYLTSWLGGVIRSMVENPILIHLMGGEEAIRSNNTLLRESLLSTALHYPWVAAGRDLLPDVVLEAAIVASKEAANSQKQILVAMTEGNIKKRGVPCSVPYSRVKGGTLDELQCGHCQKFVIRGRRFEKCGFLLCERCFRKIQPGPLEYVVCPDWFCAKKKEPQNTTVVMVTDEAYKEMWEREIQCSKHCTFTAKLLTLVNQHWPHCSLSPNKTDCVTQQKEKKRDLVGMLHFV